MPPITSPERPHTAPSVLRLALVAVAIITLWRLAVLVGSPHLLHFDEAQYWAWSKDLAFGYFSKPPMLAWAIAASTALCGDGEACVRLVSPLAHAGTAVAVFFLGRTLFDDRVGLWACLIYLTLPAVALSSMLASTDTVLLLSWSLALLCYAQALNRGHLGLWALVGLFIGLGLLSKYAMVFFILSMALHLLGSAAHRPLLKRPGPWLAVAVAGLVYLPNFLWNLSNSFASYRHTGENINLSSTLFNPGKLVEFLGGQFGVFGPLLFGVLLFISLVRLLPTLRNPRYWLLLAFVLPVLGAISAQAFLSRANANWAATAYVGASVLVVAWTLERGRWRWLLQASVILHLGAAAVLYNYDATLKLLGIDLTARTDPMKRVRGWDEAGAWVRGLSHQSPDLTLLFDERSVMATMLYYARPEAFSARMWNPRGQVLNHYELTASLEESHQGQGFLYITQQETFPLGEQRFESVEPVAILRLHIHQDWTLALHAWRVEGFRGY